ncbi:MAG: His/Gly/Thr/Pro-type tRNA ligase C-terminal domain-containing protein, partial [Nanoarchaeota archaeon]
KTRVVPYVVSEPSQGVDRAFLAFLYDAYMYDKKRENVILSLHPKLSPIKAGVFPLLSNKPELVEKARDIYLMLREYFTTIFDTAGSIGRRYARMDEVGTPICITIDFDTLKDDTVTLRDRDTTEQKRVKYSELVDEIRKVFGKPL